MGGTRRHTAQRVAVELTRMSQVLAEAATDAVPDPDLGAAAEVSLLFSLDLDGPIRPTAIQELTGLSSGGVTKLVERLESGGYVVRKTGAIAGDRRGVSVEITRKGRNAVRSMAEAVASRIDDVRGDAPDLARVLQG